MIPIIFTYIAVKGTCSCNQYLEITNVIHDTFTGNNCCLVCLGRCKFSHRYFCSSPPFDYYCIFLEYM
jgi:hypothetical protein